MNTVCLQLFLMPWGLSWFSLVPIYNTKLHQILMNTVYLPTQSFGILPSSRPHHHPRKSFSTPLPWSCHSTLCILDSWHEKHPLIRAFF
jgi:hypothetical protein